MSSILSTSNQARWKDSFASSAKVGLTVRANGEEGVSVYTQDRQIVQAGFDAPTVAPTVADAGGGGLPAGYCAYAYCYASSSYANVEALVEAGGELWPKSNPSPASAVFNITASHQNNVTVTKSNRSDVDKILIYRTAIKSTLADAQALADAGQMNYVGVLDDNFIPGTVDFADNVTASAEEMELDNYSAPQFWKVVYESPYWWGFGNPELIVAVTLAGNTTVTAAAHSFFAGRQNQLVTFDGVTTGGFDGKGTYYFRYLSHSVANVALVVDGAAATLAYTGTTTMHVKGFASTLYRSKPNNPFAWGFTEFLSVGAGAVQKNPQQFAFPVGGRGSAIAVLPTERLLKLDVENPSACYVLNLGLAGRDGFEASKRTIDRQYIVSSHDAQFPVTMPDGSTILAGLDAANRCIVSANSGNQGRFGTEVFETVGSMVTTDDYPRQFHGVYDPGTELSLFWLKTAIDADSLISIDTCLCFHAPSGQWSTFRDMDVTASASVYDPVTLETVTLIGTATGQIAQALTASTYSNLTGVNGSTPQRLRVEYLTPQSNRDELIYSGSGSDGGPSFGQYFDAGDTVGPVRVWLSNAALSTAAPVIPTGGRLLRAVVVIVGVSPTVAEVWSAMNDALAADAAFTNVSLTGSTQLDWETATTGPAYPAGNSTFSIGFSYQNVTLGNDGVAFTDDGGITHYVILPWDDFNEGHWCLLTDSDGGTERWAKSNALGAVTNDVVYDPATGTVSSDFSPLVGLGYIYPGLIDCEARTYFEADQTKAGQLQEVWSALRNTSAPFFRFYQEFDSTATGSRITLVQDGTKRGGDSAVNWLARDVPSTLNPQFGLRLVERGYDAFQVLGINIKRNPTR